MPVQVYSTPGVDVSPLARPLTFNFSKKTAKNRFLKAAMAESLSSWSATDLQARGIPSPELINLYRRWGEEKNSWGVILTGNLSTNYGMPGSAGEAMITPEDAFYGERFEAFQKLAAAAKANGSLIVGQVSHPGRQAPEKLVKEPISASAVPLEPKMGMTFAKPRAANKADIARVIAGFAHAAQYLEKAGFDGIELHGAHGYLLAQFLSRRTNQRTDAYGGSLRNRVRLITEIAQEIRRRTSPDFILSIKLNSVEFQEGGLTPEEARDLCLILQEEVGFDFIELSGGTYEEMGMAWEKESTRKREAFFIEFADTIVPAMGKDRQTRVYITGGLRSAGAMVKALDVVDGVGLGKPSTGNPALAADILEGRVTGAIKPVAPYDNDGGVGLVASGVQIRQLSRGLEPFDLSDTKAVEAFGTAMQPWYMANVQDVEGTRSGYFDLDLPLRKYEESRA